MFNIKIKLKIDPQVLAKLQPENLEREATTRGTIAIEDLVKKNFTKLDKERTVHGSHFYELRGRRATRSLIRGNRGIIVVDSHEMAHKYFGGEVKPVRTKYLAIPNEGEYFRRPPRSIGHGKLAFRKTRKGGLLYEVKNPNRVAYWLVREVRHKAHPETLPKKNEMLVAAKQAISKYLKTI